MGIWPRAAALRYRDRGYGYLSLLKVWLAQVTRLNAPVRTLVCSTFVQRCWQAAGYRFRRTADPGDYLELCAAVIPIEPEAPAGG